MNDEDYILFCAPEGPKLSWRSGTLIIEDLNPQIKIEWAVTPEELYKLGEKAVRTAARAEQKS
jgi:hypothetical protein